MAHEQVDQAPPLPEMAITECGDMWLLGDHKVLLGDATTSAHAARLMGDEVADMVFTDPPYNVDYEGYTEERLKMQGDRMSRWSSSSASFTSFRTVSQQAGASLYMCHLPHGKREFQNALEAAGFEVRCQIIWAKNTFAWGFGRYKFQHEPIFYCHVAGQSDPWYGDKSQSTLWQENKPAANRSAPHDEASELIDAL